MEYDNYDRLVSEQDGVQRKDGEKTFHLYDVHGRECLTGIATAETDLKNSTVFYDGKMNLLMVINALLVLILELCPY